MHEPIIYSVTIMMSSFRVMGLPAKRPHNTILFRDNNIFFLVFPTPPKSIALKLSLYISLSLQVPGNLSRATVSCHSQGGATCDHSDMDMRSGDNVAVGGLLPTGACRVHGELLCDCIAQFVL